MRKKPLRIAIIGTRGIPANYSGFETLAEELAIGLSRRGHQVTVYGRSHYVSPRHKSYKSVRQVVLPTIKHKYLDTVFHTFLACIHCLFNNNSNLVLVCNLANSPFCLLLKLFGKKVLLNVDGFDWERKKWNIYGRYYYKFCARVSPLTADRLITDADCIQRYYQSRLRASTSLIAYGAKTLEYVENGTDILERLGLIPGKYLLYVARLEPENNAQAVVKAFERVKTDMKLAMVGGALYSDDYIKNLHNTKDKRILFTGGIYGIGYLQLQRHAYLYIQASEVGGTHPALIEGMGAGNCIVYNDVPEHREVADGCGLPFEAADPPTLTAQLQLLVDNPLLVAFFGEKAKQRAKDKYNWEHVIKQYEDLSYSLL